MKTGNIFTFASAREQTCHHQGSIDFYLLQIYDFLPMLQSPVHNDLHHGLVYIFQHTHQLAPSTLERRRTAISPQLFLKRHHDLTELFPLQREATCNLLPDCIFQYPYPVFLKHINLVGTDEMMPPIRTHHPISRNPAHMPPYRGPETASYLPYRSSKEQRIFCVRCLDLSNAQVQPRVGNRKTEAHDRCADDTPQVTVRVHHYSPIEEALPAKDGRRAESIRR